MSRSKRFIAGTLAGYGNIAANIIFTLVSVPLALAYLDVEQFGLWALAAQLNGYLVLLELGMNNAINRYIADHKDDVNGGTYGAYLLTGGVVFVSQGLVIAAAGYFLSWAAPSLFSIPSHLATDFSMLVTLLAGISGLSIASRSVGAPLWAFQRLDAINYGFAISSLSFLGFLWLGFSKGLGVVAFPLAQLPATITIPFVYFWMCKRNGYYPKTGSWGRPHIFIFKEILQYGKDVFLIQIGHQLVNASHIIIVSRFIGLGAAATYAIATKTHSLCRMLLLNPVSSAAPALAEIYVRGDHDRFNSRYRDLITLSLATCALLAYGIAAVNRSCVEIWTDGKIHWDWTGDLLIAILLVVQNISRTFLSLFTITKNLKPIRYSYLFEALVFIPLACMAAKHLGVFGVLSASLASHIFTTTLIAGIATQRLIGIDWRFFLQIFYALSMIAIARLINVLTTFWGFTDIMNLIIYFGSGGIVAYFIWIFMLPRSMKNEISYRFSSLR